jgi:hypothetical protein
LLNVDSCFNVLTTTFTLKVLSSEMDLAESGINR